MTPNDPTEQNLEASDDRTALSDHLSEPVENDRRSAGSIPASEIDELPSDKEHTVAIDVGADVVCSEGDKLGEVVDVRDSVIVVEKGFFVPEDLYVPMTAVASADEHTLKLNVTREEADRSDWDHDPEGEVEDESVKPKRDESSTII